MPETDDIPPTLASLRSRKAKLRTPKRSSDSLPEFGPLFAAIEPATETAIEPVSPPEPPAALNSEPSKPVPATLPTERRIWSVRSLVAEIRQQVESAYDGLWVEGEISNCRIAPSGYVYLTLKDGEAQLPVVLFRRQAQLLRFRPADGLAVLVRGRISVYESRGQLQLIAETMEPRGSGALQLAFEQLKARLLAEGLFDADRKRPLSAFPRSVGIITSPTGAVIRDIVTVVRRRHVRLNLLVYPATMQGAASPPSVIAGIRWFNDNPAQADIIVIARGGGSMEDLACFNDEALARTIAASELPIVSAIGHETDFTIADFVADLRAPTPSAAAELVTAAQHRIEERIEALATRVRRAGRYHLMHAHQRYGRLSAESVLARLRDAINRRDQRLDELSLRLESSVQRRLRTRAQRLAILNDRLRRQEIGVRIIAAQRRLQAATQRLQRIATKSITNNQTRLNRASSRLEALSPVAVLSRGYALVYASDGRLLRSAAEVSPGETIQARLGQGAVEASVTRTRINLSSGEPDAPDTTEKRSR